MIGYVLTLREPIWERVDLGTLSPDRLAVLSAAEIERLPLRSESGAVASAGDLFRVSGSPASSLRIVGDVSTGDRLGARMGSGELRVEGNAGRWLGRRMSGGRIEVTGGAGNWTGLEMSGGRIVVRGSVGRGTGGASPGSKQGMTGGEVVVHGDAGAETGACMRRGMIAVAGSVGADAARAAIAGTVLIGSEAAGPVGRWSKRGTVVALAGAAIPATYRYACTFRPPSVSLLLTYLRREYGFPVSEGQAAGLFRRYSGDMAESGRGEILHRIDP